MNGSVHKQVRTLFHQVDAIGTSRHHAKELAKASGGSDWHSTGKLMGIHSYQTSEKYLKTWREFGNYVRSEFRLKDMQRVSSLHVGSFLEAKMASGVRYSTFTTCASALQKLEVALNRTGVKFGNYAEGHCHFAATIAEARSEARGILERNVHTRAYESPQSLINGVTHPTFNLAASMQLESGARVGEISRIHHGQLDSANRTVEVKGKGGKVRHLQLSDSTFVRLEQAMEQRGGVFGFSTSPYRSALKEGAQRSSQPYSGSHGLRWNFAQNRMAQLTGQGMQHEQALVAVSKEMGHERGSITEHYLQGPGS
ncbi:site-specific integrase [Desulfurispira natronophila]|uniref:Site-specific recombinase XerD n=1 Tax=Desulfurispira natronophila TaxID=682562 RepID=A0A7W7Y605_9BACT|nr:site-specific integrase [Desulfurispira natronophila]MBB5022642.1 site-specific recombinase XerD [Desulfurispira natronophila]